MAGENLFRVVHVSAFFCALAVFWWEIPQHPYMVKAKRVFEAQGNVICHRFQGLQPESKTSFRIFLYLSRGKVRAWCLNANESKQKVIQVQLKLKHDPADISEKEHSNDWRRVGKFQSLLYIAVKLDNGAIKLIGGGFYLRLCPLVKPLFCVTGIVLHTEVVLKALLIKNKN